MLDTKDKNLLVEIAVMYYLEGKTQTEISKELFMSRPKVSRLLKRAREMNIVDIKINYESDDYNRIKSQIQHRFGIENVVVIKTMSNEKDTIKEIGRAAASELKYHIMNDITIGMSWGRTVKAMVSAFKDKPLKNVKIVELFGAVENIDQQEELLGIGYDFSKKINGKCFPLPAPIYIDDQQTRDILLQNPIIKKTLQMIDECDLIVTSLGVVNSDTPQRIWDAHVKDGVRANLIENGAIGFLCAHFFDKDGNFIEHEINDKIIGIRTERIKQNKLMLVAGGESKCKAIYAVLKGGYVNTLVSDDKTLKKILQLERNLRGE